MARKSKPAQQQIVLDAVLDLTSAVPLATALRALAGQPVRIDASRVARIGVPALQVLMSAKRSWDADAVPLTLDNPSPALAAALDRLGLPRAALLAGE